MLNIKRTNLKGMMLKMTAIADSIQTPQMVVKVLQCLWKTLEEILKKTAHYRRAQWLGQQEQELSKVLNAAFSNVGDSLLPIFDIAGGIKCMIARRSNAENIRFLHLVTYESGAPVAVINTQIRAAEINADEQEPDGEHEFIQSQLFCLIFGNHILWATHNEPLREGRIQEILSSFALANGVPNDHLQFGFQVVLDHQVIQRAFDEGIEEIDLNLGDFRSTLERLSNGGDLPYDGLLGHLRSVFVAPASAEQLNAAEKVEGKLILRPGHDWNKPDVRDFLVGISNRIRENFEEEFVIVTKSGFRLTRDKISVKRECDVQGSRRVLNSIQLETEMRAILAALRSERIIE